LAPGSASIVEMDPVLTAAIAFLGVVIGATLTALLDEWRSRKAEQRASARAVDDRLALWHLDRVRQTRRVLEATVIQLEAMAGGNLAEHARGQAMSRANPDGNIALIGDVVLIREVHDLFVFLNKKAGKGLEPADQVRRVDLLGRVDVALDAQEQRILKGESPLRITQKDAPELFDAMAIATRMDAYAVPPSMSVRFALWFMRRFLRRWEGTG
jgi:hypothetical protein